MKETNLDRKRAYWLVKVPALENQSQKFFEMMFYNYYRPQELCLVKHYYRKTSLST